MISPTPPPPPPQTRYYDGKLLKLRMEPSNENYSSVNDGEGHQRITTKRKPPMVHPHHHHHHSSYQSFSSNSRYRPYPRMRYNVYPSPAAPSQMLSTLNGRVSSSKKAPRNSTTSNPSAPRCPGCLCGNNDDASSSRRMHMKLLHNIMSRVVYSNDDDDDILAKQRPGVAICYDGLIFLFEGKPARLVVRSENCTGQPWCPPCHEQRELVACMLKDVMEESNSDELERIKFVPSLAEAQIQKLRAELEDYKANGVVVVPV
eukprot:scaffold1956_cov109-Cylindrotheca_fusiformis.AAC.3